MDISTLSFTELVSLKSDVENEIKRRESEEKTKAKKQIIELAKAYGLSVKRFWVKWAALCASRLKPSTVTRKMPN
jgi:DNA-binding protein H-NS